MFERIKEIDARLDALGKEERQLDEERTHLMDAEALKRSPIKPGQIVSATRGRQPGRFRISRVIAHPYCDIPNIQPRLFGRTIRKDGTDGREVDLHYARDLRPEK